MLDDDDPENPIEALLVEARSLWSCYKDGQAASRPSQMSATRATNTLRALAARLGLRVSRRLIWNAFVSGMRDTSTAAMERELRDAIIAGAMPPAPPPPPIVLDLRIAPCVRCGHPVLQMSDGSPAPNHVCRTRDGRVLPPGVPMPDDDGRGR